MWNHNFNFCFNVIQQLSSYYQTISKNVQKKHNLFIYLFIDIFKIKWIHLKLKLKITYKIVKKLDASNIILRRSNISNRGIYTFYKTWDTAHTIWAKCHAESLLLSIQTNSQFITHPLYFPVAVQRSKYRNCFQRVFYVLLNGICILSLSRSLMWIQVISWVLLFPHLRLNLQRYLKLWVPAEGVHVRLYVCNGLNL